MRPSGSVARRDGRREPHPGTRVVAAMKPCSIIVDVSIDQGGCAETSRPTTHSQPTFMVDGVVHYCVANMPGAVPRTSTFALDNATRPFDAPGENAYPITATAFIIMYKQPKDFGRAKLARDFFRWSLVVSTGRCNTLS